MKIQGLYTALVTPFHKDGTINFEEYSRLINFQIAAGVDGLVVLGSTGEAPTITAAEKKELIALARKEVAGRCPLIVGTGSYSTAQTIENSEQTKALGADGLLVVTPYYNKPTPEGLFLHFKALTESVALPIIVYAHQGRTAQNVVPETLNRIAKLPGIAGVKLSATPMSQICALVELFQQQNKELCILSGDDPNTLALMAAGGNGAISIVSNFLPLQMQEMVEALLAGDLHLAQKVFYQMLPLMNGCEIETNPIPVKAAMAMIGMNVGGCRLPLCDLMPNNQAALHDLIQEHKELIDFNYALYSRHAESALTR